MRTRFLLLTLAVLPFVMSCGSDGPTAAEVSNVAGVYALRSNNGRALPDTIIRTSAEVQVLISETLTLNGDLTYLDIQHLTNTIGGVTSRFDQTITGRWTVKNNSVTLIDGDGVLTAEILSANTLRLLIEGVVLIYKK